MVVKKHNKLVRDRIPEIIENSGRKAVVEKMSKEASILLLRNKLEEECREYLEDRNIDELVDIVEVIYAILEYSNVSITDFEEMRRQKAAKRGAYKERYLLKEVIEG